MTGAYVRIERGNKWENVEVEYLTRKELEETFHDRGHEELINWIEMLCNKVRENSEILNGLVESGVLMKSFEGD